MEEQSQVSRRQMFLTLGGMLTAAAAASRVSAAAEAHTGAPHHDGPAPPCIGEPGYSARVTPLFEDGEGSARGDA